MIPTPEKFIKAIRETRYLGGLANDDLIELARMVKDGELVLRSDLTEKDNAA